MQHNILRPQQALNKAYLKLKTPRQDMERFKHALTTLLDSLNMAETEEHAKNHLRDFLKSAFYEKYGLNTKGKTDKEVLLIEPDFAMPKAAYENNLELAV